MKNNDFCNEQSLVHKGQFFYFKEKMKTLKDKWQNGDDTDIPDEMDVIMSCNTGLVRGDN